jgi:pimeloyl-ACP methyl ester carboxylesterase
VKLRLLAGAAMALLAATPASAFAPATDCEQGGIGRDSVCTLGAIRLHYVDHGGEGPVVILIAGLGSSARIFDDFGPLLRRGHRVLAFTRRGYGLSGDAPDGDYSNAALVGDILGLMDRLGVDRASFVGHSLAGGELATLGADHPDRVDRLVYIDAAYDRAAVPALMAAMPPMNPPSPEVRASLAAFTAWREQALGVDLASVAADVAATMRQTPAGLVPRTRESVAQAILAGDIAAPEPWAAIAAPSLAFYSSKDVAEQLPPGTTDAQRTAFIDYSVRVLRPWMLREQAEFLARRRCGRAVEVPHSTHHLFLERPDWLAERILAFLASPSPCGVTFAD